MSRSSFERRIKELCNRLVTCESEAEAIELSRELQKLIHERIEAIRSEFVASPAAR